jgi:hypothetical protein
MRYWTTALGKRKRFNRIGHQHLSNILWFKEVFNGATTINDRAYGELLLELRVRYNGKRKPWKPLPIPNEIDWLVQMGLIINDDIIFKGTKIGSIKHINLTLKQI